MIWAAFLMSHRYFHYTMTLGHIWSHINITIARPNLIPTRVVNWALANYLGCIPHVQVVHLPGSCQGGIGTRSVRKKGECLRIPHVTPRGEPAGVLVLASGVTPPEGVPVTSSLSLP